LLLGRFLVMELNGSVAPVITLLTDFGSADAYVGCMKGVILNICPHARVIDVSHGLPKFNIQYGAFILMQVFRYFPNGTIHVAVVDPGVGTRRRPLVIETKRYFFVGPDNGVLTLAASEDGIKRVVEITSKRYMLSGPSKTFAGREIFAPVAAHIAMGVPLREIGPKVDRFQVLSTLKPKAAEDHVVGEVFVVDSFGNLIMNIRPSDFGRRVDPGRLLRVEIRGVARDIPFVSTYGDVGRGQALALVGSSGFIEIDINQGNASRVFKVRQGTPVKITFSS